MDMIAYLCYWMWAGSCKYRTNGNCLKNVFIEMLLSFEWMVWRRTARNGAIIACCSKIRSLQYCRRPLISRIGTVFAQGSEGLHVASS